MDPRGCRCPAAPGGAGGAWPGSSPRALSMVVRPRPCAPALPLCLALVFTSAGCIP